MTKMYVYTIEKGTLKNPSMSMPLNLVDDCDMILLTCSWVKKCPFCGLELEPLHVRKGVSCNMFNMIKVHIRISPSP
jgi:hypothetical protein